VDHLHVTPTGKRQTKVEQAVLQHLPTDRDRLAFEHREIRDAKYTGAVLLQEHHRLRRPMQGPPLLHPPLQGALAPEPLLIRPDLLEVQKQGLGF
jgi:hypothetical protein